jgi:hypothetical protein
MGEAEPWQVVLEIHITSAMLRGEVGMVAITLATVLDQARQLSPAERERLLAILEHDRRYAPLEMLIAE